LRILHHLSPLRPVEKNGELRRDSSRYKKPRAVFEGLRPAIFTPCLARSNARSNQAPWSRMLSLTMSSAALSAAATFSSRC
jgi:hypothetical protein